MGAVMIGGGLDTLSEHTGVEVMWNILKNRSLTDDVNSQSALWI